MLVLPIPLIVTLILGFLLVRVLLMGGRPLPFLVLLGLCALQGILTSLDLHYGVPIPLPWRPLLAAAIPPATWLAFQTALIRPLDWRRDAGHLAAPLLIGVCGVFAPIAVDGLLPLVFLGYGGALLKASGGSRAPLPLARIEADRLPNRIWGALAATLILSALGEGGITLALLLGEPGALPVIVTLLSSGVLLLIGGLSLSREAVGEPTPPPMEAEGAETETTPEDLEILNRLNDLLEREALYLDPELTLARLARRLHVPIKRLSVAVNRGTGENISRHINGHRIRRARADLAAGHSVTQAMLASGFNTKSNFNREFKRVTGVSPSDWKQS